MFNDLHHLNNITNLLASLPAYISYGIIIFPIAVLLIYITLYKYLYLELSSFSFFCFSANIAIFLSFSLGSFSLLFANKSTPIYLNDLSILAKYRYLFICIAFLITTFFFLLSYISKPIKNGISIFLFPHLQEEVRKILYTKNETIWGFLFSYIIESLENSKLSMIFFYTVHFLVFILFRFYMVYLLIDFTFFQGDFREIWYCIPVSFIIWLLQFFNYYFVSFLNGSYIAFHNLFVFDVKNDVMVVAFSPDAIREGFPDSSLESFASRYRSIERVYVYFQFYSFCCKIFSMALFSLQLLCWFTITQFFLVMENPFTTFLGWGLFSFGFRNLPPKFMLRNAEAFMTHQHLGRFKKDSMNKETFGAYFRNHYVNVDKNIRNPDNPAEVLVRNIFTTGLGTLENPSYVIDHNFLVNGTKALPGRPQRYIPMPFPIYYPETHFAQYSLLASKKYIQDHYSLIQRLLPQEEHT